jgi:hypothetical protein
MSLLRYTAPPTECRISVAVVVLSRFCSASPLEPAMGPPRPLQYVPRHKERRHDRLKHASKLRSTGTRARVITFAIYVRDTPVFVQERMVSAIAWLRGVHERRSFISDLSLADETARRSGPSG